MQGSAGRGVNRVPAAVAALIVLALCACSKLASGGGDPVRTGGSWRMLPPAPIGPRVGPGAIWTGEEMIIWGGSTRSDENPLETSPLPDGAAYAPESNTWRPVSGAPLEGGSWYSLVWTGTVMIVWGTGAASKVAEGAIYEPGADRWRSISPGPLAARSGHLAVWVGDRMFVWGGALAPYDRERYDGLGALYDPKADRWQDVARGPLPAGYDAMGVWTGSEVIVLATPLEEAPAGRPKQASAAAYDPSTNSWRSIASPPMAAWVSPPAVLLNGRMVLLSDGGYVEGGAVNGYERRYPTGGVYDIRTDTWREHSPSLPVAEQWPQVATDREVIFGAVAYDPQHDSWRTLPPSPLKPREFPSTVWTGEELLVWGGALLTSGDPPPALGDGAAYRPLL